MSKTARTQAKLTAARTAYVRAEAAYAAAGDAYHASGDDMGPEYWAYEGARIDLYDAREALERATRSTR